jgi:hypothetical protein
LKYPFPQQCPVCQSKLTVQELKCDHCSTTIRGNFETTRLASLNEEQLKFVETFIKLRGNIREMERELGISYPTVRNRLEQVIEALGFQVEKVTVDKGERQEVLNRLDRGEITSEEALRLLKELG